jgi:hypothetical protein
MHASHASMVAQRDYVRVRCFSVFIGYLMFTGRLMDCTARTIIKRLVKITTASVVV